MGIPGTDNSGVSYRRDLSRFVVSQLNLDSRLAWKSTEERAGLHRNVSTTGLPRQWFSHVQAGKICLIDFSLQKVYFHIQNLYVLEAEFR